MKQPQSSPLMDNKTCLLPFLSFFFWKYNHNFFPLMLFSGQFQAPASLITDSEVCHGPRRWYKSRSGHERRYGMLWCDMKISFLSIWQNQNELQTGRLEDELKRLWTLKDIILLSRHVPVIRLGSLWDEFKEADTCSYALTSSAVAPVCSTDVLLWGNAASNRNTVSHLPELCDQSQSAGWWIYCIHHHVRNKTLCVLLL